MTITVKYVTRHSLRWCQDSNHVLVVDEQSGLAIRLTGLHAAIWKWLVLAYPYEKVLRFGKVFLNLPETETRTRLNQILNDWVELGLLVEEEAQ